MTATEPVVIEATFAKPCPDAIGGAHGATGAMPLPLSGDEVYMLGLPWEPWLAYDNGPAMAGDPTYLLAVLAAVRRAALRLWGGAGRLLARRGWGWL
ncbi:MAG: hypothetical protein ACYC5O_21020 [Anaerolineae bacterium]